MTTTEIIQLTMHAVFGLLICYQYFKFKKLKKQYDDRDDAIQQTIQDYRKAAIDFDANKGRLKSALKECNKQHNFWFKKYCAEFEKNKSNPNKISINDIDSFNYDLNEYGVSEVSKMYKISESTIRRRMAEYNIKIKK